MSRIDIKHVFRTGIKADREMALLNSRLLTLSRVIAFTTLIYVAPTGLATEKPQRIVSLTLCTDLIVLMLVESKRIVGLSHLATDPTYSYLANEAENIPIHHGLAEEIMPMNADLIISSRHTTNNTVQILEALGHSVSKLDPPATFSEVRDYTLAAGELLGETEKAQTIIQNMHAELAKAKHEIEHLKNERAISFAPNGFTAGSKTLKHHIMEAAGFDNIAPEFGIEYYGNISVEQLITANPDVVILDENVPNQNSLAQRYTSHPALKHFLGEKGFVHIPANLWLCPGPLAGTAALALTEQRLARAGSNEGEDNNKARPGNSEE